MGLKTSRWNVQDSLETPEDCAAFIEAAIEDAGDDPAFLALVIGEVARACGMTQTARGAGLSREGLYKALGADGNPSWSTIVRVLAALGLRIHVMPA